MNHFISYLLWERNELQDFIDLKCFSFLENCTNCTFIHRSTSNPNIDFQQKVSLNVIALQAFSCTRYTLCRTELWWKTKRNCARCMEMGSVLISFSLGENFPAFLLRRWFIFCVLIKAQEDKKFTTQVCLSSRNNKQ